MKVLAIGGSGSMGRATVRTALTYDFISEVIVAGIDGELAERFVASLEDPRVRNLHLDITDNQALRAAMRDVDVVLNSAGPFFRFGVPVLSAAIDEGKHYCDICDDWQPTLDMLALHERARQNQVKAVIGLGASPGIINLLCVKAAQTLDQVDTLVSAWKLSGAINDDDGFTPLPATGHVDAAAVHLMHCLSEKIRVLRQGRFIDTDPLEHSTIEFPGLGNLDVWSLGHPEAVTLIRRFPQLQNCYNGMLGIDDIASDLRQVASAVAMAHMSVDDAARLLAGEGGREARQARLAEKDRADVPGALAFAAGYRNGQPATAGAYINHRPVGGMATITGIPHALFLPLLQNGNIKEFGVFAPEQVIDPDTFFKLLDPFCGPQGAGLTVVTA
ncbi:saccharopine dehydrogenase family protein [Halopseudomonas maritima]|uniref:saccharopine dehydrogenase family protein n=1 Tax=Halopseudomonas maritima TaxID=2918528 RepID=UPI001EEAF64B|nr:saccharopine dehydrogenase NADP-binding domain-containing protein [Halopseudomonas maritima]UJJ30510.1 saccharopine dehydrogenase NADP-binding domain-containing protein [Halopseudomonas maritima]